MISKNVFIALVLLLASTGFSDSLVTITPDLHSPGNAISPEFCGLSFETGMLHANGGKYFFSPDHAELISLFKSLGVKNLRIGGNSADAPTVKIPSEPELDHLFAFAQAAGVQVIYNLRLKGETDPTGDIQIVRYLMSHYKPLITCFTIGNEPNVYFKEYAAYRAQWKKFADAILAEVPDALFNGPSTTPGKTAWSHDFASDFAAWGHLALVTQHAYPGGNARLVADPAAAREKILAPEMDASYEKFYQEFVAAVFRNHEQYRLEEANSLFHGGATGVSNAAASALWALDFMHFWASHGAEGINFHTGNHFVDNENEIPGGYDITYTTPSGLKTHPAAYALKAFSLSSEGRYIPLSLKFEQGRLNLTAYAVEAPDNTLILTIINKENGDAGQDAAVQIESNGSAVVEKWLLLTIPGGDISQLSGVRLGNAEIAGDGSWNGDWTKPDAPKPGSDFVLHLKKSTAAVIRLRINPR